MAKWTAVTKTVGVDISPDTDLGFYASVDDDSSIDKYAVTALVDQARSGGHLAKLARDAGFTVDVSTYADGVTVVYFT